jgi:5-methyltetrahydropteroyltriglutamate--homocysteine methyltransferase
VSLTKHTRRIETQDEVEEGIRTVLALFPLDRVYVIPDCGVKRRTRDESKAKLQVVVDVRRSMMRDMGIE